MESKLNALFDFQLFEGSKALQSIIDSTHARYGGIVELSDEELDFVAAAGVQNTHQAKSGVQDPSK